MVAFLKGRRIPFHDALLVSSVPTCRAGSSRERPAMRTEANNLRRLAAGRRPPFARRRGGFDHLRASQDRSLRFWVGERVCGPCSSDSSQTLIRKSFAENLPRRAGPVAALPFGKPNTTRHLCVAVPARAPCFRTLCLAQSARPIARDIAVRPLLPASDRGRLSVTHRH